MNNLALKRIIRRIKPETLFWARAGYQVPVPFQIKICTMLRHSVPNSDWIETGTYLAETTLELAKKNRNNRIYTIEPAKNIYEFVKTRYANVPNIEFLNGTSEELLGTTLEKTQKSINLWLDGHYSGDVTFKGDTHSPIINELKTLTLHLDKFDQISIFVDDFRLFGSAEGYPEKLFLVEWANGHNLSWSVENDIFIAKSKK
jgi:hypothetical protein